MTPPDLTQPQRLDLEEGKRLLKSGRTGWLRDWLYNNVDTLLAAAEEAEKLRELLREFYTVLVKASIGNAAVPLTLALRKELLDLWARIPELVDDAALTPPEPLSAQQETP